MWYEESVFYQIYPLGFCNAEFENKGNKSEGIQKVEKWIPHLKSLGINAVYFSPVFESDTHGYNTRDYRIIDNRLGTNEEFGKVCNALHAAGIKVVLDGVFNHAGRGFFAFQDVLKNRENSRYRDWFFLNLGGDSCYHDGLWYEGWEGNFDLVKLNLGNEEVVSYLIDSVGIWMNDFEIDGLRLDVAYCLREDFIVRLHDYCLSRNPEFFLLGEMLHGDYNRIMNDRMLHSVTNYECYKGLYSSLNSRNMFEIMHSLLRQFGDENWTLYKMKHLLCFVDNHDVTRVASILTNQRHLPLIYAVLFGMPGIPCIYYGSEWGATGNKGNHDMDLRPSFHEPTVNELTEWIASLVSVKRNSRALNYGNFRVILLTNLQCVFEREVEGERVLIGINMDENSFIARFPIDATENLITGEKYESAEETILAPYSAWFRKVSYSL